MLKIMANENLDHWKTDHSMIIETVVAVREFLDRELVK
jgi:hypothetical protein